MDGLPAHGHGPIQGIACGQPQDPCLKFHFLEQGPGVQVNDQKQVGFNRSPVLFGGNHRPVGAGIEGDTLRPVGQGYFLDLLQGLRRKKEEFLFISRGNDQQTLIRVYGYTLGVFGHRPLAEDFPLRIQYQQRIVGVGPPGDDIGLIIFGVDGQPGRSLGQADFLSDLRGVQIQHIQEPAYLGYPVSQTRARGEGELIDDPIGGNLTQNIQGLVALTPGNRREKTKMERDSQKNDAEQP